MRKVNVKERINSFVLCVFAVMWLIPVSVCAFDGPTHKYVTEKAIELFAKMDDSHKKFYTDSAVKTIMEYCTMPDEDEIEGMYKDHFYNIATEHNFMGEKMSALVKFKQHYKKALTCYKANKTNECWDELGRAIHFLEDLCTPVHAGYDQPLDAIHKLSLHVDFEKKCVMLQERCLADIPKQGLRYYVDNSLAEIGKMCSRIANDNFFSLEKEYVPAETIGFYSIMTAQRAVNGILYRFYVEAQGIKN